MYRKLEIERKTEWRLKAFKRNCEVNRIKIQTIFHCLWLSNNVTCFDSAPSINPFIFILNVIWNSLSRCTFNIFWQQKDLLPLRVHLSSWRVFLSVLLLFLCFYFRSCRTCAYDCAVCIDCHVLYLVCVCLSSQSKSSSKKIAWERKTSERWKWQQEKAGERESATHTHKKTN